MTPAALPLPGAALTPEVPAQIDVDDARTVYPVRARVTRSPMSELESAAVNLAAGVLGLIGLIAAALLFAAYQGEFAVQPPEVATVQKLLDRVVQHSPAASAPAMLNEATQILRQLHDSRQGARKVWFDFAQLMLLNLLLPVLTAVLGYVFGTLNAGSKARKPDE